MNDTELLRGTIEAVREDRRWRAHEARLDAYVEGELDAQTVAELAKREGTASDLDDELRAFEPVGAEARERIAARILEELANHGAPPASVRRGRVILFRRVTFGMSALALAASLAFVLRGKGTEPPLPPYELSFVGGEETWRGEAPSDVAALHPLLRGGHVRLVARPSRTVPGPVEARVFLRRDAEVRAWTASVDISSMGAVRVVASPETLPPGTEGDWELIVAIGRPDALPEPGNLDTALAERRGARLLATRVHLAP